jgi:CDP-2,3-bis-(O-geranylgeranyl)-sn-glycerol synthase
MDIYYGFIFLSPAFVANAIANFTSGLGPIDRDVLFFDGKPILGKNKTIGGLLGAILSGGMLGISASIFFPEIFSDPNATDRFSFGDFTWYYGFILGITAMIGDALGSFIKRRIDLKPGGSFPIMDQTGFVIISYFLIRIFVVFPWSWAWVIPVTFFFHFIANMFAYLIGWQEVWR